MKNEIESFFETFADDFSKLEGSLIAERYNVPFMAVSNQGCIKVLQNLAEISVYFQNFLDDYREQGIVKCHFSELEYSKIGAATFLAIVTWHLLDREDREVLNWRESYNLIKQGNDFLIYSSADF